MAAKAELDDAHERLAHCGAEADILELTWQCLAPAPAARPRSAKVVAQAVNQHVASAEQHSLDAQVRTATLKRTHNLGLTLTGVIAAGLALTLWFWHDADSQRGLAELSAKNAMSAEKLATESQAREATARKTAETNLANFNRLSHIVRLETY